MGRKNRCYMAQTLMSGDAKKRKEAIKALMTIAVWEGLVLVVVVGSYFATGSIAVLIGGIVASMALFAPMFLRWTREHGRALKAKPNSIEESQG